MKKSEKLSIVAGISLLVVAALFLVVLFIQLLPFGSKGSVPVLGGLGSLLFGAYGYSSLLIPCFFFAFSCADKSTRYAISSGVKSLKVKKSRPFKFIFSFLLISFFCIS